MTHSPQDPDQDVAARAAAARTVAELAQLLRQLRRREARWRRGSQLTYREIAGRTGLSLASICGYLTGTRFAPADRFDLLVHALGAQADELGPLATARDRLADSAHPDSATEQRIVPRMLPAPVSGFTGRTEQLHELDAIRAASSHADTVIISAVAGMAGVGKTALAVHWAHLVANDYPDGQLYVNLNGFGTGEPWSTLDGLGVLLSGLGVPPTAIPAQEADRAALYRTLLTGRRTLVVIDNTDSAERARPLLPPPPSLALVTSRNDLADLVAVEGAHRVTLNLMSPDEATALLRRIVGSRAEQEPDAVAALARRCGYLPLALRVVAEQAIARPMVALSALVDELDEESTWLNLHGETARANEPNDDRIDVRIVFGWSLRRLPEAAVHAFRFLGVDAIACALVRANPDATSRGVREAGTFDAYGVAALLGVEPAQARELITTLARVHLVQTAGRSRYFLHDLLRDYAVSLAWHEVSAEDRDEAIYRVLDYYLTAAATAVQRQFPGEQGARPWRHPQRVHSIVAPDFDTVDAAATWLADNRENLVRTCVLAARHGREEYAVALARTLRPFLDNGHHHEALIVHTEALAAAQRLSDPADLATIYSSLGIAQWRLGALDVAAEHLERATTLDGQGAQPGALLSLAALGRLHDTQGRFAEALECHDQGLRIAQSMGIPRYEAGQLASLAFTHLHLGNAVRAEELYRRAHAILEGIDERPGLAEASTGLAMALARLGRHDEALGYAEEALVINQEFSQVAATALTLDTVGSIYRDMGRHQDAIDVLRTALALSRDTNNHAGTAQILNTLGETHRAMGDHRIAIDHHEQALTVANQVGDRLQGARALAGLGDAYSSLGDVAHAHGFRREAAEHYAEMGVRDEPTA